MALSWAGIASSPDSLECIGFQQDNVSFLDYPVPLQSSLSFALIAWSIYEYIFTFDHEVKVLGQQKWTIASWIYIINRYLLLGSAILQLSSLKSIGGSPGSLLAASVVAFVMNTSQYIIIAVFSALRVYAIWDHSVPLSLFMLILSSGQVVINLFLFSAMPIAFSQILIPSFVCDTAYFEPLWVAAPSDHNNIIETDAASSLSNPFIIASITSRCLAATVDLMILALTWKKTFRSWVHSSRLGVRTPVTALLLRDGTAYFVALVVIFIIQIVSDLRKDSFAFGSSTTGSIMYTSDQSILSVTTPTFTCILISRFLINLRNVSDHPNGTVHTEFNSRFSIPGFRIPPLHTIIGNLGEDLEYGRADEVYDIPEPEEPEIGNSGAMQDSN